MGSQDVPGTQGIKAVTRPVRSNRADPAGGPGLGGYLGAAKDRVVGNASKGDAGGRTCGSVVGTAHRRVVGVRDLGERYEVELSDGSTFVLDKVGWENELEVYTKLPPPHGLVPGRLPR